MKTTKVLEGAGLRLWASVAPVRWSRGAIVMALVIAPALSPVFADLAPDTIAGKVLRTSVAFPSVRTVTETTIEFGADGHFVTLISAGGSTLSHVINGVILLRATANGTVNTYTYTKTGPSTARAELFANGQQLAVHDLRFSSSTDGDYPDNSAGYVHTWTLLDGTTLESAPVINVSTRGVVLPGHPMIVGFVVSGTFARDVLIRAVGPSLVSFGVSGIWADPDFTVRRVGYASSYFRLYYHYRDWSRVERFSGQSEPNPDAADALRKVFDRVGAFHLLDDSKDAAMIARLDPGAYTVVAEAGPADAGGEALVEVYCLP